MTMHNHLIEPHGGKLVDLIVDSKGGDELKAESKEWKSVDLAPRQVCDLELLLNGGFSPLTGFMNTEQYDSVCSDMRLPDGVIWPIPIILDIPEALAKDLKSGERVTLRDPEGVMLAVLHV